ncbi:MAG TPA: replicative DNA helicase [Ignavibacteria bacterium]
MNPRKPKKSSLEIVNETIEDYGGKIPPNAEEVENQILGAILIDNDIINDILQLLSQKYFYKKANGTIFQAMIQLDGRNEPIDANTVKEELQRMGKLAEVGGVEYIIDLTTNVTSSANAEHYTRIVFEKYILRRLISISGQITTKCFDPTNSPFSVLDDAEHKIMEVNEIYSKKKDIALKDVLDDVIKDLQKRRGEKDNIIGVPTGYHKLDDLTSGFQKSELIIIAGRPSHGKTALALNIARNAAVKYKKSVAFFSLEMAFRELILRLLASEALVDGQKLKTGRVSHEEWAKVAKFYPNLKTNLYIDDTSELSILELRAKARRMKQEYNIDMIIVDYLQLLRGQDYHERRDLEVAYVSRSLKALAKELDIPVVACSQLNRGIEQRGKERRPQLSDLRESGAIEQDADVVIFIHRPIMGMKMEKEDPDYSTMSRKAEVIIGKQRNGPVGDLELVFKYEYAKFENLIVAPVIDLPVDTGDDDRNF